MALFRRKRIPPTPEPTATPPAQPDWASGSGSPIGAVPAAVVSLVLDGRLPPDVAQCVEGGPYGAGPDWLDVADAIDDLTQAGGTFPGALYAMGAYGQLDGCFTMVDEAAERAERATELLDLAVSHGVSPDELRGLYSWAESLSESGEEQAEEAVELADQDPATLHGQALGERAYALTASADPAEVRAGAALYARLADESAGDGDAVLDARLRHALALFGVGDREVAVPRLLELAAASSEKSGTAHLLHSARSTLVVDAAVHEGPEAARAAWDRARRQSARFPGPGGSEWLVRELLGQRAPSVMRELAELLRAQDHPDRSARAALQAAEEDLREA